MHFVALKLFSLPHSSATVERVFSQMNLNKTKVRNALREKTLNGILHSKEVLGDNSANPAKKPCYEFQVNNVISIRPYFVVEYVCYHVVTWQTELKRTANDLEELKAKETDPTDHPVFQKWYECPKSFGRPIWCGHKE